MSIKAQKWLKKLPMNFKDESFGAIKMETSPEMNQKNDRK